MGILRISELKPDMLLADDLRDRTGRLLMSKGTLLTPKYIRICKIWGVIEADIEDISREDTEATATRQFDATTVAAAEETVRTRFVHGDMDHPAVRELFQICTLRKAEAIASGCENTRQDMAPQAVTPDILKSTPLHVNPARFIKDNVKLATLPDIFRQITEAISKPNSSAHDIASVISMDTNLSARLLKVVNSAFYGYPSRIDTLTRAVHIVGTKQLSTLAIGVNMLNLFKKIPSRIINVKEFWKHSILCGINARIIAGYKNIQNTERLFVAGLLHDIGRLLLYNHVPLQFLFTIMTARNRQELLYVVERETLNCNHADIGGELLKKWKLPISLEDTVTHHHDPAKSQHRLESSIIHVADIMANVMCAGSSGETLIPPLNHEAWTQIGLTPNFLSLTMEQSDRQLEDILESIFIDEKNEQKNP